MAGLLEGKVCLVTGAASGIGQASALLFAREGATVAIADVNAEGAEATAKTIEAEGGTAWWSATDVSDKGQVDDLVAAVVERFGTLDGAFNNAGVTGTAAPLHECDEENWAKVIGTNLTGIFHCMHAEIPVMLANGGGAIVNTSSNVGHVAVAQMPAYVTSKTAILGLTRSAAIDYAEQNIRVNALCPGITMTPFARTWYENRGEAGSAERAEHASRAPVKRHAEPAEIAEAAAWLLSSRASYATGAGILIDGGWTAA
jgi:NAD(P)-dependent dehydrogenase (short-subunit alcohol dehydrogenase family)